MGHLVRTILSPVTNLLSPSKPGIPQLPSYANAGGDTMKNIEPQDAETRANQLKQQAAAAGSERTDNQADLLGNVRAPKKRSAAMALLG